MFSRCSFYLSIGKGTSCRYGMPFLSSLVMMINHATETVMMAPPRQSCVCCGLCENVQMSSDKFTTLRCPICASNLLPTFYSIPPQESTRFYAISGWHNSGVHFLFLECSPHKYLDSIFVTIKLHCTHPFLNGKEREMKAIYLDSCPLKIYRGIQLVEKIVHFYGLPGTTSSIGLNDIFSQAPGKQILWQ